MKKTAIAISFVLPVILASCSGEERKINKAAADYGRTDAMTLIERVPAMTPLELEGYLLGVRATENDYRESGHDKAADIYVEGFEDYIRQNCDSLARIIF